MRLTSPRNIFRCARGGGDRGLDGSDFLSALLHRKSDDLLGIERRRRIVHIDVGGRGHFLERCHHLNFPPLRRIQLSYHQVLSVERRYSPYGHRAFRKGIPALQTLPICYSLEKKKSALDCGSHAFLVPNKCPS
ncbi:unnamed protein product [Sphacelaria rigidula]